MVVPCKNEGSTIRRCLEALRREGPAGTRIVVVDNGSTDGSPQIARGLADEVLEIAEGTISTLRNRGADACGAVDVLAFVDADTEVDDGWLAAGLQALADGADLVGSRSRAAADAPWVARRWAEVEAARAHAGSRVWSQHLLIRAETFAAVGGFPQRPTGEDAELSIQVEARGGTVALVPGMGAVHHGFPGDLRSFLRRERWHTRAPGWYPRMARGSRALVLAGAGWAGVGTVAALSATFGRRPRALAGWAAATTLAVPALGLVASRDPRRMITDGALLSLWTGVRVLRLPQELLGDRLD
ncbi:glycosyltransferase [Trujillonella humicola]|uniref:glycosyltransferase n=1 Tax=Trujillonella humicola TaxID=3383699 RepID=UPI003905AEC4